MVQAKAPEDILSQPLTVLPGIGPRRAEQFAAALGVQHLEALLRLLPRRYQEPARVATVETMVDGARVRISGTVEKVWMFRPRGRRTVLSVRLADSSGSVDALFFNQPYLRSTFAVDKPLTLEGKASLTKKRQLLGARRVREDEADAGTELEAIYPEGEGLTSGFVARTVRSAHAWLDQAQQENPELAIEPKEALPDWLLKAAEVPPLGRALRQLHFPQNFDQVEQARRRLAFAEVLRLEHARLKGLGAAQKQPQGVVGEVVWQRILARLPFELTADQQSVLQELRADLAQGRPLRRLIHGEVSSGKTAVAFAMALAVAATGGQVALLAPTEILARQHLDTFRGWLQGSRLQVHALLGDDPAAQRRATLASLQTDKPCIAIGTHALFGPTVKFAKLSLVIFDEQQRFGVRQKATLVAKGKQPHVMTMTATPIPRTLAWARYGALEPCILRTRAGNQAPITTKVRSLAAWGPLAVELAVDLRRGQRVFLVAPRIDGPDGLLAIARTLQSGPWQGLPMRIVHGRLPGAEVAQAVQAFRQGKILALLGTSVVEVGLDVPNVPRMVVLGAERFGLASLHQLRGRLARGPEADPGHCDILAATEAVERLKCLETCQDGFAVADLDLEQRGPGVLRGQAQHGHGGFQVFDPIKDQDLVNLLRQQEIRNWLVLQG